MIRINLLGIAKPAAKQAGPPTTVARQALIFVVSAVVAFGVVGFMWRYWSSEIDRLDKKKAELYAFCPYIIFISVVWGK